MGCILTTSMGSTLSLVIFVVLCWHSTPADAFGAGNIASISVAEGLNWRHGDIEDILLTLTMAASCHSKKFDSLHVKRVYFGNWLRDYSQAIDVGSLKYVDKTTIRMLLWVLSFMSFGYATGEFEVTEERLGCYRPEEHIDNPRGYPANAQAYDKRLRGPVNEALELAVDPETGMKNYIANERIGIMTSANLVRRTLGRCIELGRSYARTGIKKEKYEALRLLGTGLHCLEDFAAHSNYLELALRELGEHGIFPHVGVGTQIGIQGKYVFPLTTGTFGGVDLLHSVLGEASDKIVQSEIQQLEDSIAASEHSVEEGGGQGSIVQNLLNMIPASAFQGGAEDGAEAGAGSSNTSDLGGQAMNLEALAKRKKETGDDGTGADIASSIYKILEFHDTITRVVSRAIDSIPGLTKLMESLTEAVSVFVFSLLAPYLMPLLKQAKGELNVASSEVISEAKAEQFVVFNDPYFSDPTHSMLSKDHFTCRLNEPAGRVAQEIIKFAVPLIMQAWDDERIDIGSTLNNIIAVLHHPALRTYPYGPHPCREAMFEVVRKWWQNEKSESERQMLRYGLSVEGIQAGANHKEGHDTGSGSVGYAPITKLATTQKDRGLSLGSGTGSFLGVAGAFSGAALGGLLGTEKRKEKEKYSSVHVQNVNVSSGWSGGAASSYYAESTSQYGHGTPQYSYQVTSETKKEKKKEKKKVKKVKKEAIAAGLGLGVLAAGVGAVAWDYAENEAEGFEEGVEYEVEGVEDEVEGVEEDVEYEVEGVEEDVEEEVEGFEEEVVEEVEEVVEEEVEEVVEEVEEVEEEVEEEEEEVEEEEEEVEEEVEEVEEVEELVEEEFAEEELEELEEDEDY